MADTSIKLSGTYDSIEAYNILEEMREMSTDYEEIKEEAEAAASAATAAVTTAQTAANNASTYADNAQTYAGNANTSAGEAAGYASDASTAATNAATSETNASDSASAAATSESNASDSEDAAAASATAAAGSASAAAASAAEVESALDDYLPLAGGTMTGTAIFDNSGIYAVPIKQKYDDAAIRFYGGSDDSSAFLWLFGKNSAGAGRFDLFANDGTNSKNLRGTADGTLTWDGNIVSSADFFSVRSTKTTTRVSYLSGNADNNGGGLFVYGKDYGGTGSGGNFTLQANNGTNSCQLNGKPDGSLTWSGKTVERVNAYSAGSYIRYESGLQICLHYIETSSTASTAYSLTFAQAFSATPRVCASPHKQCYCSVGSVNSTKCSITTSSGSCGVEVIAIGRWK